MTEIIKWFEVNRMGLFIALIIASVCFVGSLVFMYVMSKAKYKSGRLFTPTNILLFGVIVSSIILFIPLYSSEFESTECSAWETFLISVHNVIRLFVVDGDFAFVTDNISGVPGWVFSWYTVFFSVLFVLAPALTFNFVLSFFKNISAYKRYMTHFKSDVFIFSELNEKSLALAKSLYDGDSKKRFFVFADVYEKQEEENHDMVEKAKEIGAVCFKKDVLSINFAFHSKKSSLNFFTIGEDQSNNVRQALELIEKLKYRANTNLYVFSTQLESEILLANAFNGETGENTKEPEIRVRRVNEVRSLIFRNLYDKGYDKVFKSARPDADGVKRINAIVIGMGLHGTEMAKALAWFSQMDGYEVEINCFDSDKKAKEKFISLCPELMAMSGKDIEGEAKYKIDVHPNVDVDTSSFDLAVSSLPRTTYVFVALGNDEKNISTAVKLRMLFERLGYDPEIQAVVYNTDKKEALANIKNFKGMPYNIDFIGDMKTSYSEDVILDSEVELKALARHTRWGSEKEFWQYDYNYKSSVASAIHREMKSKCAIPGIDKEPGERSESELWNIRILEHKRWNAYMRAEGYVYGGTVEKSGRNDLAKMHNCLVPFAELPLKEQEKDDD